MIVVMCFMHHLLVSTLEADNRRKGYHHQTDTYSLPGTGNKQDTSHDSMWL